MIKIIFPVLLLLFSCKEKNKTFPNQENKTIKQKVANWQEGFGLTHSIDIDSIWGKPVRYYVTNKKCDSTAIKFYLGTYRPTDEPETERLLHLVTTDDSSLRPFYRWILNKTIIIQDGALGEYTGIPAREYVEKFPKEFFEYMDFDKSGKKYSDWCNSITYSGFYNSDDYKNPERNKENIVKTMNLNCSNCDKKARKRILKFADDCFSSNHN